MGLKDRLIHWILHDVKVPSEKVIEQLDKMDKDKDGYISVGELVDHLRAVWKELNE